jgi:hypothetical protein
MWPHERPVILAILAGAQGRLLNKIFQNFPNISQLFDPKKATKSVGKKIHLFQYFCLYVICNTVHTASFFFFLNISLDKVVNYYLKEVQVFGLVFNYSHYHPS